jgi:hypothetical protein
VLDYMCCTHTDDFTLDDIFLTSADSTWPVAMNVKKLGAAEGSMLLLPAAAASGDCYETSLQSTRLFSKMLPSLNYLVHGDTRMGKQQDRRESRLHMYDTVSWR